MIRDALSPHLQVSSHTFLCRRSADPPPEFIQLLGDVVTWLPLTAPATVFLSTLAKRAANAVWDSAAGWFAKEDVKPVMDVATALVKASDRVGGRVVIAVGLNIPDDLFGAVLSTDSRDTMEVAKMLSALVVRAEKISAVVRAEIERGPVGSFFIELQGDQSVIVRWRSASDFKDHEKHIP